MTVASAQTIRDGQFVWPFVDPAEKDSRNCSVGLSSCGYDLTLAQDVLLTPAPWPTFFMCIIMFWTSSIFYINGLFWLTAGSGGIGFMFACIGMFSIRHQFVLASTIEHFMIPDNIVARVHDKSSLARLGISVQNTVAEPGWRGYLTLEISNHGMNLVRLSKGDAIAQVIFEFLDKPTELPYQGKYQDQPNRPVEAL